MRIGTIARIRVTLLWVSRLLVGITFVASGYLKGVDPVGLSIKMQEYFHWLHISFLDDYTLILGAALSGFEFLIGGSLILGLGVTASTALAFITMIGMTLLTLVLALTNPVSDCGCFGEVIKLTNWETFLKNLILLPASFYAFHHRNLFKKPYGSSVQFMPRTLILLYFGALIYISYTYLPRIDSTPFKVGNSIIELMSIPEGKEGDLYESTFIYSKEGVEQEFTIDKIPTDNSQWSFVRINQQLIKKGYEPPIKGFNLLNDLGDDLTDEILNDQDGVLLLVGFKLLESDDSNIHTINDLYDQSQDDGLNFYGVTASTRAEVEEWRNASGAEYAYLFSDPTSTQTLIRTNPGLVLLKKGIVLSKWSSHKLPTYAEIQELLLRDQSQIKSKQNPLRFTLFFFGSLSVLLLALYGLQNSIMLIIRKVKIFRQTKAAIDAVLPDEFIETHILPNQLIENKMRKNIVAGNWKMNKNFTEGLEFAKSLATALEGKTLNCEVVIGTPFIHLACVADEVKGTAVQVAAQNCADKKSGAFTGEVSAEMVASTGTQFVILGHSERRAYYGETSEMLKEKTLLALANGLTPIFCIGEVLEEREASKHFEVVKTQIEESLFSLPVEEFSKIVLAYEPVWAIGTGKTASPAQAQEMHAFIRQTVADKYGKEVADNCSILYGGSCNASNAKELFTNPDVDGGLIGGASLVVDSFMPIIEAFN